MLKVNCIMAQTPFICEALIKKKSNGMFKLKLVSKHMGKGKYSCTSLLYNRIHKEFTFNNCDFDSVDFMFNSNGIRRISNVNTDSIYNYPRINDMDSYFALTETKKRKNIYIFNYKASCNKTIYYVVRYATNDRKFYKCIVELKHNSTDKPVVKIIPIEQIAW